MCLQPPPTPPFIDMVCQAFGCGYQGGGLFFAAVRSGFPTVILKEPKRVFRIYFQRVVMLHCKLNYPRIQNQSLPFELDVLRSLEFDTRGRLGGVGGLRLNVGLGVCNPLQLPLFSTWFAKHLDVVIKGEGYSLLP